MKDIYNREVLNEKVRGNLTITITKLTHIYLPEVKFLVTVNNGRPIPMFSNSYKTLGAAKRKYNTWR